MIKKSHRKDTIPQADGHIEQITTDAAVLNDNNHEYKETENPTDSPFKCRKYCKEIIDDKSSFKRHMLKEYLYSVKILSRRHFSILQEALEYMSFKS